MADQPGLARRGHPIIDNLYMEMTTGRTNGKSNLAGARDVFGALSLTTQFKVSLHLANGGQDNELNGWLRNAGLTDSSIQNTYYDFYCNSVNIPGANFSVAEEKGSRQGVIERFPVNRIFLPVEMSFYVDNEYKLIRLFEEWMNYINPLHGAVESDKGSPGRYAQSQIGNGVAKNRNDFFRVRYPDTYKRIISITKFERDFQEFPSSGSGTLGGQGTITYRLIDAYPTQISAIPLSYETSSITQVNVTFDYTRYVYELNPATRRAAGTQVRKKPTINPPNILKGGIPSTGTPDDINAFIG